MILELYQIDTFTDSLFKGNPACVVPLKDWLADELMLNIARENAVAETAFFIMKDDKVLLRWFTPEIEMDLCGHATLATAHVLRTFLNHDTPRMVFSTASGNLEVMEQNGLYTLDLPARKPEKSTIPENIERAINTIPVEVYRSRDIILIFDKEQDVRDIRIDRQILDEVNLDPGGVIITAPGNQCDFVSRFFTPQASIFEDPVTGSAHCSLIPLWSLKLAKKELFACQLSDRGGKLFCKDNGDRVLVGGKAKTFSTGKIFLK
jgi:PhzF family phenazine biosynthesis protein